MTDPAGASGAAGAHPRVLIVSNQGALRAGIRRALAEVASCAEASDFRTALEAVERDGPDVVVVDARTVAGADATGWTAALARHAAVVVLTPSPNEPEFLDVVRAGAVGYLPVGVDPQRLPDVLAGVVSGEPAVPRRFVGTLMRELTATRGRRAFVRGRGSVELSPREWDVLQLLRDGQTTREIAGRLDIAEATVRRHVARLLKKLRVSDRAEAVALVGDGLDAAAGARIRSAP